jgi:hypothetical protein
VQNSLDLDAAVATDQLYTSLRSGEIVASKLSSEDSSRLREAARWYYLEADEQTEHVRACALAVVKNDLSTVTSLLLAAFYEAACDSEVRFF